MAHPKASEGEALRIARTIKGLKRRELAAEAGVTELRIVNVELGRVAPRADELRRLWQALIDQR